MTITKHQNINTKRVHSVSLLCLECFSECVQLLLNHTHLLCVCVCVWVGGWVWRWRGRDIILSKGLYIYAVNLITCSSNKCLKESNCIEHM